MLNNWYRAQSTIFDASLAYEFLGFGGPDASEGLASHKDKRDPKFVGPPEEESRRPTSRVAARVRCRWWLQLSFSFMVPGSGLGVGKACAAAWTAQE